MARALGEEEEEEVVVVVHRRSSSWDKGACNVSLNSILSGDMPTTASSSTLLLPEETETVETVVGNPAKREKQQEQRSQQQQQGQRRQEQQQLLYGQKKKKKNRSVPIRQISKSSSWGFRSFDNTLNNKKKNTTIPTSNRNGGSSNGSTIDTVSNAVLSTCVAAVQMDTFLQREESQLNLQSLSEDDDGLAAEERRLSENEDIIRLEFDRMLQRTASSSSSSSLFSSSSRLLLAMPSIQDNAGDDDSNFSKSSNTSSSPKNVTKSIQTIGRLSTVVSFDNEEEGIELQIHKQQEEEEKPDDQLQLPPQDLQQEQEGNEQILLDNNDNNNIPSTISYSFLPNDMPSDSSLLASITSTVSSSSNDSSSSSSSSSSSQQTHLLDHLLDDNNSNSKKQTNKKSSSSLSLPRRTRRRRRKQQLHLTYSTSSSYNTSKPPSALWLVDCIAHLAFGRHEYKIRPIAMIQFYPSPTSSNHLSLHNNNNEIARSYEGGLCVYMATSIIVISSFYDGSGGSLSKNIQFLFTALFLPPIITYVEVKIPHTIEESSIALVMVLMRIVADSYSV